MQSMNTQKPDTANARYLKCFIAAEIQWPDILKETMILYVAKTFTAEWINFMIISSKRYLLVWRKVVFRSLIQKGYKGGQTAAYDYMNKIIKRFHIDIAVYRSSSSDAVQRKNKLQKYDHLSRNGIFRFLWMNHETTDRHKLYLIDTYPQLRTMMSCIREFREISQKKKTCHAYIFLLKNIKTVI